MAGSADRPRIVVVGAADLLKSLRTLGFSTQTLRSVRQLLRPPEGLEPRAIVLGPQCDPDEVISLLPAIRDRWPLVDVVVWRPRAASGIVRDTLRAGAKDVMLVRSPHSAAAEVRRVVEAQVLLPHAERASSGDNAPAAFHGMLSRSRIMWNLYETVRQVAPTDATVLILGETGTGKELLARSLHEESDRQGRFVALNCGAVSETLIDSELFGYVKGAFTGAAGEREGLFRHADHGTLMLDEIGNIPLAAQYRLLRVLQEGSLRPVGGHSEVDVDVRVVAATSTALEDDVRHGRFREDLFYRLDVIRLEVPPLRSRPEDIVFLFAHFARRVAEQYNVQRPDLSSDFLDALTDYPWPGNVRQLENLTERLVLTKAGSKVNAGHLNRMLGGKRSRSKGRAAKGSPVVQPPSMEGAPVGGPAESAPAEVDLSVPLEEALKPRVEALERAYLEACLKKNDGRVIDTARMAGISRRTLLRKMKQHDLDKNDFRAGGPPADSPTATGQEAP